MASENRGRFGVMGSQMLATRYSMLAVAGQFSAECRPPAPLRNSTAERSGSPGRGCAQFQRQAPQWTHFSRSNAGTPSGPGVMAWPEQASMQIRAAHSRQSAGCGKTT